MKVKVLYFASLKERLLKGEDTVELPEDVKTSVQADVDALKTALAGEDDAAVKTAYDALNESQQKLGEAIYAQGQEQETASDTSDDRAESADADEDVIDAEVVEDEDEKK